VRENLVKRAGLPWPMSLVRTQAKVLRRDALDSAVVVVMCAGRKRSAVLTVSTWGEERSVIPKLLQTGLDYGAQGWWKNMDFRVGLQMLSGQLRGKDSWRLRWKEKAQAGRLKVLKAG